MAGPGDRQRGSKASASGPLDRQQRKHFHFLGLPGEIRNRIYDLVFIECWVQVHLNRRKKRVDHDVGEVPQAHGAQVSPKPRSRLCCRCLAPEAYPRHDRGHDFDGVKGASFLRLCRQVHDEALTFLYAKTTFRFASITTIQRFLNAARLEGVREIKKVELVHGTYGEPELTEFRRWKICHDRKWMKTCQRMAEMMTGIEELKVHLHIRDWPTQLNLAAAWAKPLLVLSGGGCLGRVEVTLQHNAFSEQRLRATARVMAEAMTSEEGRQRRRLIDDLEKIQRQEEGKRDSPEAAPLKATKVLSIIMNSNPGTKPSRDTKRVKLPKGPTKNGKVPLSTLQVTTG